MAHNMVLAVAKTSAIGAVAKFHLGMREISNTAGCAGMERFSFSRKPFRLVRHDPLSGLHSPENIFSKEQKEVADRGKHEQPCRPRAEKDLIGIADPREQGQPLDLYRKDEEDVQLKVRIQEGECQEHGTADENVRRSVQGHDERHCHGDDIADKKKKVITECAPVAFEGVSHEIEQIPREKCEDRAGRRRDEQERDKPPPLSHEHPLGDEHDALEDEPA